MVFVRTSRADRAGFDGFDRAVRQISTGATPWKRATAFLLSCVQPDGGIYSNELQSYNTSVVLSALALRNRPQDRAVIENARRRFLIGLQVGDAELGANSPFSGGIGYGASTNAPIFPIR